MSKNLFLEINDQRGPWPTYMGSILHMWAKACIRRHTPTYAAKVSKTLKKKM